MPEEPLDSVPVEASTVVVAEPKLEIYKAAIEQSRREFAKQIKVDID
jgi:hypothetical protein